MERYHGSMGRSSQAGSAGVQVLVRLLAGFISVSVVSFLVVFG